MSDLETFKKEGTPVYVPKNRKERLLKGWELGGEFMRNPEYVEPKPIPKDPIKPLPLLCAKCGIEVPNKLHQAIEYRGGSMITITCCASCIKQYGQ